MNTDTLESGVESVLTHEEILLAEQELLDAERAERAAESEKAAEKREFDRSVLAALKADCACDQSAFSTKAARLNSSHLASATALVIRPHLRYADVLDTETYCYGWLIGSELTRPYDKFKTIDLAYQALVKIGDIAMRAAPGDGLLNHDELERLRSRLRMSPWIEGKQWNGYRSLLGDLKPLLLVSDAERAAACARWLLSQPLEPVERPTLFAAYSADRSPGGARTRQPKSEGDSNEFTRWLEEWNGGPLRRSVNNPVVPLDSPEFLARVQEAAHVLV